MMVNPKLALSEAIEQLNNSKADAETTEKVLREYGYEKLTPDQLQQYKENLGL